MRLCSFLSLQNGFRFLLCLNGGIEEIAGSQLVRINGRLLRERAGRNDNLADAPAIQANALTCCTGELRLTQDSFRRRECRCKFLNCRLGVIVAAVAVVGFWSNRPRSPRELLSRSGQSLLCFWGLAAYMGYLGVTFGEPLACIKSQEHWNEQNQDFVTKVLGLLTFEPIWSVYNPHSPCYWARVPPRDNILLSMKAANPVYFLVAIALVCDGARRRWLNRQELLLAGGCFVFLYWFGASRGCMNSMARYSATVFPVYLVLGRYLAAIPSPVAAVLLSVSGAIMAVYSILFVSWYWFF